MYDHQSKQLQHTQADHHQPYTIKVEGEGQVTAEPDRAIITLGVISEGMELRTVQADNATITTQVIQSLRQLNIPPEQIQTVDYRVETEYDYIDGKQLFRGYKVTHLLQITTDRMNQAGILVDTAVTNGANTVTGIRYTLSNTELYENQALALAVRNAISKAGAIAYAMGITIQPTPVRVRELPNRAQPFQPMSAALKASSVTPLSPGQITITAAVRAWFNRYGL
ncbi:SIMPL domain-containing protein [Paenibacillus xylaniclasticus]|uniref:SIMPL domain-containing protein n=1 Tax=Paenibacillus xylaniclasticus TaxID=588083 RepID=UPI000FD78832|nr:MULTISPECIES: SIMPL domain-containing protein [Paenibacillus]GFN31670.1 hypothetical protein PCURB6_19300 [Paenibacillus curdlanolyticus]